MPYLHLGCKLRPGRFVCAAALVAGAQDVSQRAGHAGASLRDTEGNARIGPGEDLL